MRIRVVVPVSTGVWNAGVLEVCQQAADRDTTVEVVNLEHGPESIECMYDEETVAPFVIEAVVRAEAEGADAAVIYCFGNPALEGSREAVSIPVIGLGEAAEVAAMPLGDRFGIISTLPEAVPRHYRKARLLGTDGKLAAVVPLGLKVMQLGERGRVIEAAVAAGRELLARGAQVVVLGCGSLLGVADELRKELGVPVVIPAVAAIKLAEVYVKMRAAHSKLAYPRPPEKVRK